MQVILEDFKAFQPQILCCLFFKISSVGIFPKNVSLPDTVTHQGDCKEFKEISFLFLKSHKVTYVVSLDLGL
jgi:hypothetical protein